MRRIGKESGRKLIRRPRVVDLHHSCGLWLRAGGRVLFTLREKKGVGKPVGEKRTHAKNRSHWIARSTVIGINRKFGEEPNEKKKKQGTRARKSRDQQLQQEGPPVGSSDRSERSRGSKELGWGTNSNGHWV